MRLCRYRRLNPNYRRNPYFRRNPTYPEFFGPYRVIQELARGGQGIVLKAQHKQLGNFVAIKILLDNKPKSIKRFKQEAQVLARIRHPNLLQVIDFGEFVGPNNVSYPYMVMELIDGDDLKSLVNQRGIPDFQWSVQTLLTICRALKHAHHFGIIHRDIKPANILIEKGTGRPILIDFGMVKRDASLMNLGSLDKSRLSVTGEILGTPAFMAPEQVDSEAGQVGTWTDVYGLGSTLFYLLTGKSPYDDAVAYNIIFQLMNPAIPSPDPQDFNPDIPDYLWKAVVVAMQKDYKLRPKNAEEFCKLLQLQKKQVLRRRRKYLLPVALSGLGVAGLMAYFMSQGMTRKQAEKYVEKTTIASIESKFISPSISSVIPSPQALQNLLKQIVFEFDNGNYESALKITNSTLESYPASYEALSARAAIYWIIGNKIKEKDNEEAKKFFIKAKIDIDKALPTIPKNEQEIKKNLTTILERIEKYLFNH